MNARSEKAKDATGIGNATGLLGSLSLWACWLGWKPRGMPYAYRRWIWTYHPVAGVVRMVASLPVLVLLGYQIIAICVQSRVLANLNAEVVWHKSPVIPTAVFFPGAFCLLILELAAARRCKFRFTRLLRKSECAICTHCGHQLRDDVRDSYRCPQCELSFSKSEIKDKWQEWIGSNGG